MKIHRFTLLVVASVERSERVLLGSVAIDIYYVAKSFLKYPRILFVSCSNYMLGYEFLAQGDGMQPVRSTNWLL